ncbi:hypothetical protein WB388_48230, partial [Streptomyces brasiliscabiei]
AIINNIGAMVVMASEKILVRDALGEGIGNHKQITATPKEISKAISAGRFTIANRIAGSKVQQKLIQLFG